MPVFKSTYDRQKLTNCRPISILRCFSKVLGKLVHSRMIDFLNYNSVLCLTQYRYRPKQSTVYAFLNIFSTCFDNVEKKKLTGLLLLDLIRAFDTVLHKILLAKLNHYGIRGFVNTFFEPYLTNKSQPVIIHDNHSSNFNINIGVPPGSSLGPLLLLHHIITYPIVLVALSDFLLMTPAF